MGFLSDFCRLLPAWCSLGMQLTAISSFILEPLCLFLLTISQAGFYLTTLFFLRPPEYWVISVYLFVSILSEFLDLSSWVMLTSAILHEMRPVRAGVLPLPDNSCCFETCTLRFCTGSWAGGCSYKELKLQLWPNKPTGSKMTFQYGLSRMVCRHGVKHWTFYQLTKNICLHSTSCLPVLLLFHPGF